MTEIIKALALIMMFVHHFFTFPSWWIDGIDYPFVAKIAPYICAPLKLCVPIFCFLSGYFYFFHRKKTLAYSARKITDILISYWTVFIPLAIIAVLFSRYHYTFWGFLRELFAIPFFPTMIFCWYVYFYYVFMLFLPVFTKILPGKFHLDLFVSLAVLPLCFCCLLYVTGHRCEFLNKFIGAMRAWFPNVAVGYIFAKYNLFSKIEDLFTKYTKPEWLKYFFLCCSVMLLPLGRYIEPGYSIVFKPLPVIHKSMYFSFNLDIIYAPFFIFAIVEIFQKKHVPILGKLLQPIGKYSLLMWFIHCIFFANSRQLFQPILYFPKNPIIVTIWGLLLCLLLAIPIDYLAEHLKHYKNKFCFHDAS